MKLYYEEENAFKLYEGKMQDVLPTLEEKSIDSIVCDPPYEINFMQNGWDNSAVAFQKETWQHCFRVLKPGGYLLAFGGTRTYHRIACAIEDAGFEIRDCIMYLYGSGMPKGQNVGLMIDKKRGIDNRTGSLIKGVHNPDCLVNVASSCKPIYEERQAQNEYAGYNTALKPAYEPVIVARKPVEGTVADNILKYGVGAMNIDECRVGISGAVRKINIKHNSQSKNCGFSCNGELIDINKGRYPANVITDGSDEVAANMPINESHYSSPNHEPCKNQNSNVKITSINYKSGSFHFEDNGSACRYFYTAKTSSKDRDEGLDIFEDNAPRKNIHPTVKPTTLMQYLVRLVTPKGGTVLDPFMGSGSTGKATMFENRERNANYKFIGVEMTEKYLPICKARIDYALHKFEYDLEKEKLEDEKNGVVRLF